MNINEKITRKINLEKNDGLSTFINMAAQQTHEVYEVFFDFINEVRPIRILEIGTALGGFTQFLKWVSDEIKHPIEIWSFDVIEYPWYKDIINTGVNLQIRNVFSENFSSVEHSVINFIQDSGTTIVLCDGGYKIGEFNILSNYLKSGDFIMAHDYAESREKFDNEINRKKWNWFEISNDDIKNACVKNNLEYYKKEIFEDVVWTCRQKK